MIPKITIARRSGASALQARIRDITRLAAYVGIPADAASRKSVLAEMAGKTKGKRKKARLEKATSGDVNNAELLFIFSKGSPLHHQPPRPVLEPAVKDDARRHGAITRELAASAKASLAGDGEEATRRMGRAALAGQSAARRWFVNPDNNWAPNSLRTVKAKGSDRPGIDTGAMRAAIIGITREES